MLLTVKGIRGVDHAELEMNRGKISLLAGKNGAGKTSVIFGAQAVLGAQAVPRKISKKDFAKAVINNACKEGSATIKSNLGTRRVSYPACEIHTLEGKAPLCNEWALGLMRLSELKEEERAKQLIEITGSKVTRERIAQELNPLQIDEKLKDRLIVAALTTSFESASKIAANEATQLKGEFKAATGINWGSTQGQVFLPEGWEPVLANIKVEDLRNVVKVGEAELERKLAAQAVIAHQEKFAGKSVEYGKQVQEWTDKSAEYESKIAGLRERYETARKAGDSITCSGCGMVGRVEKGKLIEGFPVTGIDANEAKAALDQHLQLAHNATYALALAKSNFDNAVKAKEESETTEAPNVEAAREFLAKAKSNLKAKIAKDTGMELHFRIVDLLKASDILAPDGLPRKALYDSIGYLNASLAKLCEIAEWKRVEISPDLEILYGGIPYWLISKSEKFRADVVLQMTIARILEQQIVVIDEADILDGAGRGQLIQVLEASGLCSLVAMTAYVKRDGTKDVPNLADHGLGQTYWIENGVIKPL